MLSAKKLTLAKASTYYEKEDNYYLEQVGEYYGRLKSELGLDDLTHDSFQNLLNGISPDGEMLVHSKKNKEDNVPAVDFTLSPSKSLSIAYEAAVARGDINLADKILSAHDTAVNITLDHIENEHIRARFQKKGIRKSYNTGNMIASKFQHDVNRALEPQLHTHSVIFNFTKINEKYRALDLSKILKKNSPIIKNIGQYYRNVLKTELIEKGFGLRDTDKTQSFFELESVNEEVIKAFSKRREMIEKAADKIQKKFPKMRKSEVYQKACLQTRVAKKDVNRDEVRDINMELMSQYIDVDKLLSDLNKSNKKEVIEIDQKELQNSIKKVQKELTKWHKTPLNVATKVLSKLPTNINVGIQDLYSQIKHQEKQNQELLNTMHEVLLVNLKATKLDTQKFFKSVDELKKLNKYQIEEILENGKPGSDRVRSFAINRKLSNSITGAELFDDRDVRDLATTKEGRATRGAESERVDNAKYRNDSGVTIEDIRIAERGQRDSLNKNNKER